MTAYTSRVIITAPHAMADLCADIGRGIDEDLGGEHAFRPIYASHDAEGKPVGEPIRLESDFYATPDFAAGCGFLLSMPDLLCNTIARDYSLRWPDYTPSLTPPKLEQVQAWCEAVTFRVIE